MLDKVRSRDKVVAVNCVTNHFRQDAGNKTKPRIYTVSVVGDSIQLFQVGTWENPLKFSMSGLPLLNEHSRASPVYKYWKGWKLVPLEDFFNGNY